MRNPRHKRAERQIAMADDAMQSEGVTPRNRRAIPPNAYDDLLVSTIRGQAWSRRT